MQGNAKRTPNLGIAVLLFAIVAGCSRSSLAPSLRSDPPNTTVSVPRLEFDSVTVDSEAVRSFRVSNTGGGVVSGAVRSAHAAFVVLDSMSYALEHDASVEIRVAFRPTVAGAAACSLDVGGTGLRVACEGVATDRASPPPPPPRGTCFGTPETLDFGPVPVGATRHLLLTIVNNRSVPTTQRFVHEGAPDFAIISPQCCGEITIPAHGQIEVQVRFAPTLDGERAGRIGIGFKCMTCPLPCDGVTVVGVGLLAGIVFDRDTVLTRDESPHRFAQDVTITNNATVRIEPGAELRFAPGRWLLVGGGVTGGTLLADGTASSPIRFTGESAVPGAWGGIELRPTAPGARFDDQGQRLSGSSFRNCVIEYATGVLAPNGAGLECTTVRACSGLEAPPHGRAAGNVLALGGLPGSTTWLRDCEIRDNTCSGLYVQHDLRLEGCRIEDNAGVGARTTEFWSTTLTVRNCVVSGNGQGGISITHSMLSMESTSITNNRAHGLYIQLGNVSRARDCNIFSNTPYNVWLQSPPYVDFTGNWWGTTDESLLPATMVDCAEMPLSGCVKFSPVRTTPVPVTPASCAPAVRE